MSTQPVPLLPETAPFNPAQRAWLNGFFAGLMSSAPGTGTPGAGAAGVAIAAPVDAGAAPGGVAAYPEGQEPWHDDTMPLDERMELAKERPLNDKLMAAMAQQDCGSCGYLCRSYADAIASGADSDTSKCVPGGKDTARMLKQVLKETPANGDGGVTVTATPAAPAAAPTVSTSAKDAPLAYDRKHPFPAPLLAVKKLNREGSTKDTRFVAIDLTGSGITYEVGDSLGVYPRNCADHVNHLLETLGHTGNEPVRAPNGDLVPLREGLEWHYTITRADEQQAVMLADCATDAKEARKLRTLADDDDALERLDLWDLLLEYRSARPRPGDLVLALKPLQPRLYSISSSQKAVPDEVHLTVGVVRYELNGRPRRGVASTYFAERVEMGQPVRVFVQKSHGFGLPADGDKPIIMVGPGTGVAPFRAFLQERAAVGAKGRNWLFFGDQRRSADFLYEHELARWIEDGVLTRLDTAFSRDQEEKVYVQNRMLEQGAELWKWLEDGAHFYVCGDASRMAADVDKALQQVVVEHGGMSESDAKGYVKLLRDDGRYQRDVY
ncbi:MAG: sulfite reductase subunit alpha [Phycisphaera sp.]|nr:sulfite reductase subunit alpha [Phycisphaera sp.]